MEDYRAGLPQSRLQAGRGTRRRPVRWLLATASFILALGSFHLSAAQAAPAAQGEPTFGPIVTQSTTNDLSPPLRSITPVAPAAGETIREIPNFRLPNRKGSDSSGERDLEPQGVIGDPLIPPPILTFEGVNNLNGVLPPDTQGDVGPNHYVQMVNSSFAIWDRSGTLLYGPANNNTLFTGFGGPCETTNDGDPIVLYDELADRWMLSQFALPNFPSGPFYECIAVSQTADPTGAYYRYEFEMPVNKMNDYPKFGVWPDAYYMSVNQFNAGTLTWGGAGAAAFERAEMLAGNPAQLVYFDQFSVNSDFGGQLPSDLDGPAPPGGTPNFFTEWDDSTWIGPNDAVRVWEFVVDWVTPANSTFGVAGQPNVVVNTSNVDPDMCNFDRNCIPQPGGTAVDAISDRLMFRTQYRNFGSYETLVMNHTVDVDGTDHAGIHWIELRDASSGWTLQQDGVYAPDSDHRWMGSVAMDKDGNIALGYSVSSSTTSASIRYTGRLAGDPLGTLPQGEATLIAGSGYQSHSSGRWGDYSMMSVDPVDDCTFWYTQEYYALVGSSPWQTRVGSFRFSTCGATHTVFLPLVLNNFPPPPSPLQNGDFESGPTVWTEYSLQGWDIIFNSASLSVPPHGGDWAAWLGGDDDEISYIEQVVTVPTGSPYLGYWHWIDTTDICGYDYGGVLVNGTPVTWYDLCAATGGWQKVVVDLTAYAGQTVTLQFRVETDFVSYSSLFVDDVAFQSSPTVLEEQGPSAEPIDGAPFGPKPSELRRQEPPRGAAPPERAFPTTDRRSAP